MVARGAGAVGCAHCTQIGAVVSCQVCEHLVCEPCAADWTTCEAPSGRVVRLGSTHRLRDVDPSGHLGVVTKWIGAMKLLDLRKLRWVNVTLPSPRKLADKSFAACLTADGRLWTAFYLSTDGEPYFRHLEAHSLVDGMTVPVHTDAPFQAMRVTHDGHVYYVTDTQRVNVIAPDLTIRSFEPLPRRVVQAVHLDVQRAVMASATWGEIVVHRVGDSIAPTGRVVSEGNHHWVRMRGPWIAAVVGDDVKVWRLGEQYTIGALRYHHRGRHQVPRAALSRDGRYLAIAIGRDVIVRDLDADTVQAFEREHTDDISFVEFCGTHDVLVTGDDDNRVILRPRTEAGYARPLIEIDVPDAPIALSL